MVARWNVLTWVIIILQLGVYAIWSACIGPKTFIKKGGGEWHNDVKWLSNIISKSYPD